MIMKAIGEIDEELYEKLSFIDIPTFSVSWFLTIFSHTLTYQKSARLMDHIICSHPKELIYVVVSAIRTY